MWLAFVGIGGQGWCSPRQPRWRREVSLRIPSKLRTGFLGGVALVLVAPLGGRVPWGAMCDVPVDDPVRLLRDAELDGSGFARFSQQWLHCSGPGWLEGIPWKDSAVSFLWT